MDRNVKKLGLQAEEKHTTGKLNENKNKEKKRSRAYQKTDGAVQVSLYKL
jgi:hypothetical protein